MDIMKGILVDDKMHDDTKHETIPFLWSSMALVFAVTK